MNNLNEMKYEDKRILNRSFQPLRGPGLPEGTLVMIARTGTGVYEVDYTTPYGAYGQFIASPEDLINLQNVSRRR
jgi:hypothetical protein